MSQSAPQIEPLTIPQNAYPIVRVSTEFFLRAIDLLTRAQGDKLISGLVFIAVWHSHMQQPDGGPVSVRELARRLALPYATVRRYATELVRAGQCTATPDGLVIPPAVRTSRANVERLRRMYLNSQRMLIELTRAGAANYQAPPEKPQPRRALTREQMVIAKAATRQILEAIRLSAAVWDGDLLRALVYTAIWTANVKHVTNTAPASSQSVLADELRQPVSVLAISDSLRLPYETVRRHAAALEKSGLCRRVGSRGMVVPGEVHRKFAHRAVEIHAIMASYFAELRRSGVAI